MKIFFVVAFLLPLFYSQETTTDTDTDTDTTEPATCETHLDCPEADGCLWGNCTQYCDWGNNCFPACQCGLWEDAINGVCPNVTNCTTFNTCETHADCPVADAMCLYDDCSQYCDDTNRCFPSCECHHWEDSVDGVCPETLSCEINYRDCESHDECETGEYCDDTNRCWVICDCFVHDDAVDGECPNEFGVMDFCETLASERGDGASLREMEEAEMEEGEMEEGEMEEGEMEEGEGEMDPTREDFSDGEEASFYGYDGEAHMNMEMGGYY